MPTISKQIPKKEVQANPIKAFGHWAEMVKIEHTVFALPFALSGLVLASPALPSFQTVFWTTLAFLGARSAAMTLNRIIDAAIDSKNPRTSDRAIPAGIISVKLAVVLTVVSFALMLFAASHLPQLCLLLSPIAIFFLSLYSFTKRFTWLCHIVLGICLGGAALGGWIAANGSLETVAPWLLALAVTTWVAGFDIIYALHDIEFDRKEKLFSIPGRFGAANSLNISSLLHLATVIFLSLLGIELGLGLIYMAGVVIIAAMLIYEHYLVKADDFSKINAAFFTTNGIVSIIAFFMIVLDHIWQF